MPSSVVIVTTAVPDPRAAIIPLESTNTTLELLDVKVTFLLVALLGEIVYCKSFVQPVCILILVSPLIVILETATSLEDTVICKELEILLEVDAIIVQVPALTPVTTPSLLTVAILGSLLDQVSDVVALLGDII